MTTEGNCRRKGDRHAGGKTGQEWFDGRSARLRGWRASVRRCTFSSKAHSLHSPARARFRAWCFEPPPHVFGRPHCSAPLWLPDVFIFQSCSRHGLVCAIDAAYVSTPFKIVSPWKSCSDRSESILESWAGRILLGLRGASRIYCCWVFCVFTARGLRWYHLGFRKSWVKTWSSIKVSNWFGVDGMALTRRWSSRILSYIALAAIWHRGLSMVLNRDPGARSYEARPFR